jgi:hypothetical protein
MQRRNCSLVRLCLVLRFARAMSTLPAFRQRLAGKQSAGIIVRILELRTSASFGEYAKQNYVVRLQMVYRGGGTGKEACSRIDDG